MWSHTDDRQGRCASTPQSNHEMFKVPEQTVADDDIKGKPGAKWIGLTRHPLKPSAIRELAHACHVKKQQHCDRVANSSTAQGTE